MQAFCTLLTYCPARLPTHTNPPTHLPPRDEDDVEQAAPLGGEGPAVGRHHWVGFHPQVRQLGGVLGLPAAGLGDKGDVGAHAQEDLDDVHRPDGACAWREAGTN